MRFGAGAEGGGQVAEKERLRPAVIIGSIGKGRSGHAAAERPASQARLRRDVDMDVMDFATAWLPDVMSAGAGKAVVRGRTGFAAQRGEEAVEIFHNAGGGFVIRRDVHPQRFHRDIRGLSLHAPGNAGVSLELLGPALAGQEPGTVVL
jgi:hypothetical protein